MTSQTPENEAGKGDLCWFETAVDFALQVISEGMPSDLEETARLQAASYLGAVGAGLAQPDVQAMVAALGIPEHLLQNPFSAAADFSQRLDVWCISAMAYDYDDFLWLGHTSHSSVAAALTPLSVSVGPEAQRVTPETMIVIGNEIGGRLAAATVLSERNGQLWLHIHAPVAALVFGMRLGLGREALVQAMSLASAAPPAGVWGGFMGADSKAGLVSAQLQIAWKSVLLARQGFGANPGVLEQDGGVLDTLSFLPLYGMLSGLGTIWLTRSLHVKEWPGCAYLQPVLAACMEARTAYRDILSEELPIEEIAEIQVNASLLSVMMHELAGHYTDRKAHAATVTFEIKWALAVLLDAGSFMPAILQQSALEHRLEARRILVEKTVLQHNGIYTAEFLSSFFRAVPVHSIVRQTGFWHLLSGLRALHHAHGHSERRGDWLRLIRGFGLWGFARLAAAIMRGVVYTPRGGEQEPWYTDKVETFAFPAGASVEILCRDGTVWSGTSSTLGVSNRVAHAEDVARRKFKTGWEKLMPEDELDRIWNSVFSPQGRLAELVKHVRS